MFLRLLQLRSELSAIAHSGAAYRHLAGNDVGIAVYSRLRLPRQALVQWSRIERILHSVAQDINDIDTGVRGRARLVVPASTGGAESEAARGAAASSGACIRIIGWRAWYPRDGVHAGWNWCLGWHVHGVSGGLVVVTLSGHDGEMLISMSIVG
jgi:hypothetical protein